MSWNYRLVKRTPRASKMPDVMNEPTFSILEVFYDGDGKPNGWGAASVMDFDDEQQVRFTIGKMADACTKPMLEICPACDTIDGHKPDCTKGRTP